ncbi:MAG TPA: hypothetical protein EYG02_13695 [Henriciella marina]|uniref:hypothetical protein n=1 Tax=Henriciella sp. TaxID=1968823 RepID=UPI0017E5555B|nr:hypothetical protein [Henriciella sp.]HIG22790.1 hypothetical protein [Henriciella sp.]HIK66062.1 hypothetical protein [Henriciella marina]
MKLTRSTRAGLLLLACLGGISIPAHGRQVSLEPTSLELSGAPGSREHALVTLQNDSAAETIELTIGLADWSISADGQLDLEPPGIAPGSMADWVRFSPAYVSLAPGEAREILVDIKIPDTASPATSNRTALLASAIAPVSTTDGGSLLRKIEETSLIYLTGRDAESLPVIESITRVLLADGSTALRLEVSNTGTAHARLQGMISMDANGASTSLPLASLVVLPETRRTFLVPLDQPIPENAMVSASLANTHAPQHESGRADLVRYSAPLGEAAPLR